MPSPESAATPPSDAILTLTRLALAAPDLPSAVAPTLERLVEHTAAVGAAYFHLSEGELHYRVRAAHGDMPDSPGMRTIAQHGLPPGTPLLVRLHDAPDALFFDDTAAEAATAGFPELGVASLAAAPVRHSNGRLLGAFLMHTFAPHAWQGGETELFRVVAGTVAVLAGRLAAQEDAEQAREAALRALGLALEARDGETRGHTDRVVDLADSVAEELELDAASRRALRWGAYLHDVGKIAIPDAVLLKPDRLTEEEWAVMRSHVAAGVRFAHTLGFLPESALEVVGQHHERWDGGGYPEGRAGETISPLARIFAVADVYDALTSARPYKRAWTAAAALGEIRQQSGRQFEPMVVAAFERVVRRGPRMT